MMLRQNILCECVLSWSRLGTNIFNSRTYDDEDQGEVVREGFEPSKFNPASSTSFAVGDDDDEPGNVGQMHEESQEGRDWDDGEDQAEGRSPPKSSTQFGSLEDPWKAKDGEEA